MEEIGQAGALRPQDALQLHRRRSGALPGLRLRRRGHFPVHRGRGRRDQGRHLRHGQPTRSLRRVRPRAGDRRRGGRARLGVQRWPIDLLEAPLVRLGAGLPGDRGQAQGRPGAGTDDRRAHPRDRLAASTRASVARDSIDLAWADCARCAPARCCRFRQRCTGTRSSVRPRCLTVSPSSTKSRRSTCGRGIAPSASTRRAYGRDGRGWLRLARFWDMGDVLRQRPPSDVPCPRPGPLVFFPDSRRPAALGSCMPRSRTCASSILPSSPSTTAF